MNTLKMAVLPKCDIDGCGIDATFDVPVHGSHYMKFLCRTHYLKLADKEQNVGNVLKLTHRVDTRIELKS
ncbi:MAG: hypothetical protein QQN63_06955 [Nitrosopumilus sp.]